MSVTSTSGTVLTSYPFGLEEHQFTSAGAANGGDKYYYNLGGSLIGELNGTSTQYFLLDGLGSPLGSISNVAGSAAVQGNQLFDPYGERRYHAGTVGTSKQFTGQYNDAQTGLNYYNARYYDSIAGVFLSADVVQGNVGGENPYGYVGGNPETASDPIGKRVLECAGALDCGGSAPEAGEVSLGGSIAPAITAQNACQVAVCNDQNASPSSVTLPKHLNPSQLDSWCTSNSQCNHALADYHDLQMEAEYTNNLQALVAMVAFFEGDPESLQQSSEELTAEIFAQEFPAEDAYDEAILAKLDSSKLSDQVEGEAGALARMYSRLIQFNKEYGVKGEDGEVDAETPEAIIEAKSGALKGQIDNIIYKFKNTTTNPDGKAFVIYAPGWNDKNAQTVYETLGSLDTGQDVYVTTSEEQFIEVISYLHEGLD